MAGRGGALFLAIAVAAAGVNLRSAITSLPPVFPELSGQLRLSSVTVSLLATTPVICFGLGAAFAARLSRRFGEERVITCGLACIAAGLLMRAAAPSVLLFPGTILATGAIALLNVLMASMIKRRWPERAGLGIGINLTALSAGAIGGSLLSVPLYHASGHSLALTLGIWAGPAAAAALLWVGQWRNGSRREGLGEIVPPTLTSVHKHALAWQVTGFMGVQSLLYYAALSWLPTMFRDRGDSAVTAGNLLALMGLGNLLTSMLVPVVAQRLRDQRVIVVPSLLGTAGGLAGAVWAPLGSAPAWVLLLGVSQGSCLALAIFFTMARAPSPAVAASLSGLAQSVGYLVAAAGPLLLGLLHSATGGWGVPFVLLLAIAGIQLTVGLLAARPLVLPEASTTRASVTNQVFPGLRP